jgi:hypothetical protein
MNTYKYRGIYVTVGDKGTESLGEKTNPTAASSAKNYM